MKPRAFISFQMEDKFARDFLVQQASDKKTPIDFYDYSVQDPFDEKWKTNCKERIALTKGTIVLIGVDTSTSQAVLWEIAETVRQGHSIFGVKIYKDKTCPIPAGLKSSDVINWDFEDIAAKLSNWK